MKQYIVFPIYLAIIFLTLGSCGSSYKLASDYERIPNFHKFKTYQILEDKVCFQEVKNPITKQRIQDGIHKNMKKLGYTKSEDPDILVSWYTIVESKTDVAIYRDYYSWWRYHNHQYVYTYKEGTLVIDMIEKSTERVFWHGTVSDHVTENIKNVQEKIDAALNSIFERYQKDSKIYDEIHVSNFTR